MAYNKSADENSTIQLTLVYIGYVEMTFRFSVLAWHHG